MGLEIELKLIKHILLWIFKWRSLCVTVNKKLVKTIPKGFARGITK